MTVGCMIFFNEAWILDKTLKALRERVDKVVCVDGPYAKFPHNNHKSTDGSLEIAEKYADFILPSGREHWADEVQKRNEYLTECNEGDWVFVVDADEEMTGTLSELEGDAYRVIIRNAKWNTDMPSFRLFKMTEDTHYQGAHIAVFQNGVLRNNQAMPTLPDSACFLLHHNRDRPPARANLKGPYLNWLKEHEREFREKWEPLT